MLVVDDPCEKFPNFQTGLYATLQGTKKFVRDIEVFKRLVDSKEGFKNILLEL